MTIQRVVEADAAALAAIYASYVTDTAISFEYDAPTVEEFARRIREISARYPYLKAVDEDGTVLGYAYATEFKWRKAYNWAVETTVYLRTDAKGQGIGRALYAALEEALRSMGVCNMNACITSPRGEDPYLTDASPRFHAAVGFSLVGVFHQVGHKFGRWYDMMWMEKSISPHREPQPPVRFGEWTLSEERT